MTRGRGGVHPGHRLGLEIDDGDAAAGDVQLLAGGVERQAVGAAQVGGARLLPEPANTSTSPVAASILMTRPANGVAHEQVARVGLEQQVVRLVQA
jgi:hypothetical protein